MRDITHSILKKAIASALCGVFFAVNCVLAHSTEANFWASRRLASQRVRGDGESTVASSGRTLLAQLPQAGPIDLGSHSAPSPKATDSKEEPFTLGPKMGDWLGKLVMPYGTVNDVYLSPKKDAPFVVHIQDAHGIEEAQRNISSMIGLLGQEPGIHMVGLEGAWGSFSLEPYRDFPDPAMTKDLAEFLLKKGLIAGPEYAGLTMPKSPNYYGVENHDLYNANVQALKTAYKEKEAAIAWVDALKYQAEKLKETNYSETLKTFDKNFSGYQSEKVKLADYVRYLTATLKQMSPRPSTPNLNLLAEALNQEETLDFKRVEVERKMMVEKLVGRLTNAQVQELVDKSVDYRAGRMGYAEYHAHLKKVCQDHGISMKAYPQMGRYISYVLTADKIDRHGLLNELDTVERTLPDSLAKTAKEKELVGISYELSLLHKLVRHEMSPSDWTHYQARGETIRAIPQRLAKLGGNPVNNFDFASFEDFCRYAARRNTAIAGNLTHQMEETKTNSSVLITGGFHTEGLTALMREKQISYVVITPKITEIPKDNNYLDVLARDPVPLEQLLAGDRIYLAKAVALAGDSVASEISVGARAAAKGEEEFNLGGGVYSSRNKPSNEKRMLLDLIIDGLHVYYYRGAQTLQNRLSAVSRFFAKWGSKASQFFLPLIRKAPTVSEDAVFAFGAMAGIFIGAAYPVLTFSIVLLLHAPNIRSILADNGSSNNKRNQIAEIIFGMFFLQMIWFIPAMEFASHGLTTKFTSEILMLLSLHSLQSNVWAPTFQRQRWTSQLLAPPNEDEDSLSFRIPSITSNPENNKFTLSVRGQQFEVIKEEVDDGWGHKVKRLRVEGALSQQGLLIYEEDKLNDSGGISFRLSSVRGFQRASNRPGAGEALLFVFLEKVAKNSPVSSMLSETNESRLRELLKRNPSPSIHELEEVVPAFRFPGYDYTLTLTTDDTYVLTRVRRSEGQRKASRLFLNIGTQDIGSAPAATMGWMVPYLKEWIGHLSGYAWFTRIFPETTDWDKKENQEQLNFIIYKAAPVVESILVLPMTLVLQGVGLLLGLDPFIALSSSHVVTNLLFGLAHDKVFYREEGVWKEKPADLPTRLSLAIRAMAVHLPFALFLPMGDSISSMWSGSTMFEGVLSAYTNWGHGFPAWAKSLLAVISIPSSIVLHTLHNKVIPRWGIPAMAAASLSVISGDNGETSPIKLSIGKTGAATIMGDKRDQSIPNEDFHFSVGLPNGITISGVFDGVTSNPQGSTASREAGTVIENFLREKLNPQMGPEEIRLILQEALERANDAIRASAKGRLGKDDGRATTAIVAVSIPTATGHRHYIASAGDSRAAVFQNRPHASTTKVFTVDNFSTGKEFIYPSSINSTVGIGASYIKKRVQQDRFDLIENPSELRALSEGEKIEFARRNVLSSGLLPHGNEYINAGFYVVDTMDGDALLLFSDGVNLSEGEINNLIKRDGVNDVNSIADEIVNTARVKAIAHTTSYGRRSLRKFDDTTCVIIKTETATAPVTNENIVRGAIGVLWVGPFNAILKLFPSLANYFNWFFAVGGILETFITMGIYYSIPGVGPMALPTLASWVGISVVGRFAHNRVLVFNNEKGLFEAQSSTVAEGRTATAIALSALLPAIFNTLFSMETTVSLAVWNAVMGGAIHGGLNFKGVRVAREDPIQTLLASAKKSMGRLLQSFWGKMAFYGAMMPAIETGLLALLRAHFMSMGLDPASGFFLVFSGLLFASLHTIFRMAVYGKNDPRSNVNALEFLSWTVGGGVFMDLLGGQNGWVASFGVHAVINAGLVALKAINGGTGRAVPKWLIEIPLFSLVNDRYRGGDIPLVIKALSSERDLNILRIHQELMAAFPSYREVANSNIKPHSIASITSFWMRFSQSFIGKPSQNYKTNIIKGIISKVSETHGTIKFDSLSVVESGGFGDIWGATINGKAVVIKAVRFDQSQTTMEDAILRIASLLLEEKHLERLSELQKNGAVGHVAPQLVGKGNLNTGHNVVVMEKIPGTPKLKNGPRITLEDAVHYWKALSDVHKVGFVHGDIKPANIIPLENGAILIDFGSAKEENDGYSLGDITISQYYAAPEVANGAIQSSDVYSMAGSMIDLLPKEVITREDIYPYLLRAIKGLPSDGLANTNGSSGRFRPTANEMMNVFISASKLNHHTTNTLDQDVKLEELENARVLNRNLVYANESKKIRDRLYGKDSLSGINNLFVEFLKLFTKEGTAVRWGMNLLPLEIGGIIGAGWFLPHWGASTLTGFITLDPTGFGVIGMGVGLALFKLLHYGLQYGQYFVGRGDKPVLSLSAFSKEYLHFLPYVALPFLAHSAVLFAAGAMIAGYLHYSYDAKLLKQEEARSGGDQENDVATQNKAKGIVPIDQLAERATLMSLMDQLPAESVLKGIIGPKVNVPGYYSSADFSGVAEGELQQAIEILGQPATAEKAVRHFGEEVAAQSVEERVTVCLVGYGTSAMTEEDQKTAMEALEGLLKANQPILVLSDTPDDILAKLGVTDGEKLLIRVDKAHVGISMNDVAASYGSNEIPLSPIVLASEGAVNVENTRFQLTTFPDIAAFVRKAIDQWIAVLQAA